MPPNDDMSHLVNIIEQNSHTLATPGRKSACFERAPSGPALREPPLQHAAGLEICIKRSIVNIVGEESSEKRVKNDSHSSWSLLLVTLFPCFP